MSRITRAVVMGDLSDLKPGDKVEPLLDIEVEDFEDIEKAVRFAWLDAMEDVRLSIVCDGDWYDIYDSTNAENLGASRSSEIRARIFNVLMEVE